MLSMSAEFPMVTAKVQSSPRSLVRVLAADARSRSEDSLQNKSLSSTHALIFAHMKRWKKVSCAPPHPLT